MPIPAWKRSSAVLLLSAIALSARADYDAGQAAYDRGDFQRAIRELVPSADRDARSALLLAHIFADGLGVHQDAQQALLWQRRAAELGDIQAQLDVANMYATGRGAPLDPREAVQWYQRAAERGSAQAQFELGRVLVAGTGVPPDPAQGRQLIEQAAASGSSDAKAWLGTASGATEPAAAAATSGHSVPKPPAAASQPAPGRAGGMAPVLSQNPATLAYPATAPISPGDVRLAPSIGWSVGYGGATGSGGWYGVGVSGATPGYGYPWAAYPWVSSAWVANPWFPYGAPYAYGYPGMSVGFGFTFGN